MKIWTTLAALLAFFLQPAFAAELPVPKASYSAERIMETAGFQMTGQIYHDRGKERWEVSMGGTAQVRIMRPDLGKLILYMPQMNVSMEMALEGGPQFGLPADHAGQEPEVLGREEVAGESTTKYRTEVDSGASTPFTVFSWVTDDGIVMRIEGQGAEGDFAMYLTGLSRGPQDAALFEVPAGAQVMPANPAMLGQFK